MDLNNGVRDKSKPVILDLRDVKGELEPMYDKPSILAYLGCSPYLLTSYKNRGKDNNPLVPSANINGADVYLKTHVDMWLKTEQAIQELQETNVEYIKI